MREFIKKIGGRKMLLAIVLFAIATICLFVGIADFPSWGEFCKWLFGIFAIGNFGEHIGQQFGGKANE